MLPEDRRKDEAAARRSALHMIAAAFVVVLVGGWLVYALHDYRTSAVTWKGTVIATARWSRFRARTVSPPCAFDPIFPPGFR